MPTSDLAERYDVEQTVDYILEGGYRSVALQFPDDQLPDSPAVSQLLQQRLGDRARAFILADTAYNPLGVDEVAAQHLAAHCVVHYGRASLDPVTSLPAFFVFPKDSLDVPAAAAAVRQAVREAVRFRCTAVAAAAAAAAGPDGGSTAAGPFLAVVVLVDQGYQHRLEDFSRAVQGGEDGGADGDGSGGPAGGMQAEPSAQPHWVFAKVAARSIYPHQSQPPQPALQPHSFSSSPSSDTTIPTSGGGCCAASGLRSTNATATTTTSASVSTTTAAVAAASGSCCAASLAPHAAPTCLGMARTSEEAVAACGGGGGGGGCAAGLCRLGGIGVAPGAEEAAQAAAGTGRTCNMTGLCWSLPPGTRRCDCLYVWIGPYCSSAHQVLQLTHSTCEWLSYDPSEGGSVRQGLSEDTRRLLKRRNFLVEKTRSANIIGLLVGTLGSAGFREVISALRRLAVGAGKKTYTFLMGKPNPAKLGNFPEVDVFVTVCEAEGLILDCRDYLAPLVTPWEAATALLGRHLDPEDYRMGMRDVLELEAQHRHRQQQQEEEGMEADAMALQALGNLGLSVATRGTGASSGRREVVARTAAEFLALKRTFKGLEMPATGAAPKAAELAVEGLSGRAAVYSAERTVTYSRNYG